MDEVTCVGSGPCPVCRANGGDSSGDNLAIYSDGHGWCFACQHYEHSGDKRIETEPAPAKSFNPVGGSVLALPKRGLRADTCEKFNYRIATHRGAKVHVADYVRDGKVIGQKIRGKDKQFQWIGNGKNPPLWGMHLWKTGGKKVIVTEGEIDCMSVSQTQDNKWPVVSLPSGAAGAAKAFKDNLEYLNTYENVDICFDNDEPGRAAAIECALLLAPGKARIITLSRKDANEYIMAGDTAGLVTCLWNAVPYRPDGIIHAKDVDTSESGVKDVYDFPWDSMTKALYGRRSSELCIHTSGSGMGKSTVLREMQHFDMKSGGNVGVMMLEESVQDTLHSLMSLELNLPIRKILAARAVNTRRVEKGLKPIEFDVKDTLTDSEYDRAKDILTSRGLYLYDHFGSVAGADLIAKMDYMVTALGCKVIYLDHISIVISGLETGNERKDIDVLMTNLRSFVQRTGCRVEAVCHLTKPDGQPYEEGGQISLKDLRGSGSLYQLADSVIGYERNQQDPNRDVANTIVVRSLKDRYSGFTGVCAALQFGLDTNRLTEVEWDYGDDGSVVFGFTPTFDNETNTKGESIDAPF